MIPQVAVRHLEDHRDRQDAERLALGAAWKDHGLVFASSLGTPLEPRNVNRRWDELRDRAGLGWLRLHDLRHGCATFMQMDRVAPAASFSGIRECGSAAPQHTGLPEARRSSQVAGLIDLRCHHPVASEATMTHPVRLHWDDGMMHQEHDQEHQRGGMRLGPFSMLGYSAGLEQCSLPVSRRACRRGRSWMSSGTRRSE